MYYTGLTATGGVISDYTDPGPGTVYRAHIFTSTGTFNVTCIRNLWPANCRLSCSCCGGGGGGDSWGWWWWCRLDLRV
jgi:hypothetical protein